METFCKFIGIRVMNNTTVMTTTLLGVLLCEMAVVDKQLQKAEKNIYKIVKENLENKK